MTHFNEENTVEQMVLDTLCGGVTSKMVAEEQADYPQIAQIHADEKSADNLRPSAKSADKIFWRFVPAEELSYPSGKVNDRERPI